MEYLAIPGHPQHPGLLLRVKGMGLLIVHVSLAGPDCPNIQSDVIPDVTVRVLWDEIGEHLN